MRAYFERKEFALLAVSSFFLELMPYTKEFVEKETGGNKTVSSVKLAEKSAKFVHYPKVSY